MGAQYHCQDPERRELARANGRNGIDYLEVLDSETPDGGPPQRTLLVYFLDDLTANISPAQLTVGGGVRVTGVQIEWTARASAVDATLVSPAELAFFTSLDADVLIVRTDRYGDHSTYQLVLDGLADTEFDPRLLAVDFSFKAECPHDFDCAPDEDCPPEPVTEPQIDYLARDYGGFRRILLDRLSILMPDWEDRDQVPDIQVALVEALSYVGDRLSYYQDAVATEAYLDTAKQRISLRRHGRLLDYRLHEGCNARTWVHLAVSDTTVVPPSTQFLTQLVDTAPTVLPPDVAPPLGERHPYEVALEFEPDVFESMEGAVLFSSHNEVSFYTWGDEQCCLPKGAIRATLLDDEADRLRLRRGDVLVFEEVRSPVTGLTSDADPSHRHAVRLTNVTPEASVVNTNGIVTDRSPGPLSRDPLPRDGASGPAVVEIEWDEADALPFPLCLSTVVGTTSLSDVSAVRANVVLADHGRSAPSPEELEVPTDDVFRPTLDAQDITYSQAFPFLMSTLPAASRSIFQDPRAALPVVTLSEGDDTWEPVLDLLDSDRFARRFVAEIDNQRRPVLRFGDDIHGRRPTPSSSLPASTRSGAGTAGNVGRDSLTHVVLEGPITAVRNPLRAMGGIDPESAANVRLFAPEAFRIQERAVTQDDYAEVSERRKDIQKAAGTRRWTGSWHTMFVTVDRTSGADVDAVFDQDLTDYLDIYRLAGQDVEVDGPRFVALDIAMTVCVSPEYFRADVAQELYEVFGCSVRSGGRLGFFHPDRLSFGETLFLSTLIEAAMAVAGVAWVDVTAFQRWGEQPDQELEAAGIEFDRLEIPQVENDRNAPERGRIEFVMEGGL